MEKVIVIIVIIVITGFYLSELILINPAASAGL